MDTGRWQRVREVFLSVCDLEGEAQRAALAAAAGGDRALAREVEALLAGSAAPSVLDAAAADRTADDDPLVGADIGPWRLVAPIAHGGMGAVYRAERADDAFHKTVALKLVRRELVDRHSVRRFRTERQALALLEHPNIARLLDGGVARDGTPYLVMEYVDGQQICAHADARRLSLRARLELFRAVCRAVQFAHGNLVIHRDLKPGNILVATDGTVKLLDFGIAKILGDEPGDGPARTLTGCRPFTPEYASPEQIRGDPLNTSTDVYSLGVVLYELLSGRRPFVARSKLASDLERDILTSSPPPPSAAVRRPTEPATPATSPDAVGRARNDTPARLSRRLRGDLDNIVLMAMHREPGRRYASVQALLDDIDNYLASRPVEARPDSFAYRAARFVQRRWLGVAAALLVLAAAVTGATLVLLESQRAARERDRATGALAFLQDILSTADPAFGGADTPIRQVLADASQRVGVEFADDPETRAMLQQTIGSCCFALALYDEAESNLLAAIDVLRALPGDHAAEYATTANILSNVLFATGQLDAAGQLLATVLELSRDRLGPDHELTAQTENNLGSIEYRNGHLDLAEQLLRRALATRRRRLGSDDLAVAETLNNLVGIAHARGDLDTTIDLARQALDIRAAALPARHPLVIQSMSNLALFLHLRGRTDEAAPMYRDALERSRAVLGADHPDNAFIAVNLAALLADRGETAEATELLRASLRVQTERLPPRDPRTLRTAIRLGACERQLGNLAEAEELLTAAHRDCVAAATPEHAQLAGRAAAELAEVYTALDRPDEAARWRAR